MFIREKPSDLLSRPGAFTHGVLARDAQGAECYPNDELAVSFCLVGAVMRTHGIEHAGDAACVLQRRGVSFPIGFGDSHDQAACVRLLKECGL